MGALSKHCSQACVITGKESLSGAELMATMGAWPRAPLGDSSDESIVDITEEVGSTKIFPAEMAATPALPVWDDKRYWFQSVLTATTSSGGQIELYLDLFMGTRVVAKRFPAEQLCDPGACGSPWQEIEITQCLGNSVQGQALRGVCKCYGAFQDARGDALLVSEYVPSGDLFELASDLGEPGPEREAKIWPVLSSFFDAVTSLHDIDVAHGDVSLENALWPSSLGEVVLIDFEAAVVGNFELSGTRGKPAYQAPEMHTQRSYDARAADLFSCGVVAYMLAIGAYPWTSTKPGVCPSFSYAREHGMEAFLRKKCTRIGSERRMTPVEQCMSNKLVHLLCSLLSLDPTERQAPVDLITSFEEADLQAP